MFVHHHHNVFNESTENYFLCIEIIIADVCSLLKLGISICVKINVKQLNWKIIHTNSAQFNMD